MRVLRKINPLNSSLRRPLLMTLILVWSFCIAPMAQADTVVLTSPTNLVATAVSTSQINLTWTDNSNYETGYIIERKTGSGTYSVIANIVANSTAYTDSGLSRNTVYTYRVKAMGNGSNISNSGYSGEASASTSGSGTLGTLTTPGNLVATLASTTEVDLTWTDYANGETGYIVERSTSGGSFSVLGYLAANSQSFPDTGVAANTTYTYRVQARGDGATIANSAYSNLATITTVVSTNLGYLPTPTNLTASVVSQSQIILSWTDNASVETGYIIERAVGSGSFVIAAYLSPNSQSYSDSGLSNNTTYRYRVQACSSVGNSPYSNEVSATTGSTVGGTLPTPTNLIATAVSSTQINLTWTDNASAEIGYVVERATGSNGSFTLLAYLAANSQLYTDTGLTADTTYRYRVQARGNGTTTYDSSYSNEATPGGTIQSALGTPSGLTATAVTTTQINLVWIDNASAETGYTVERAIGSDAFSVLAYLGPNAQTFSDTGLTANTIYRYRVQARDNVGTSDYSNEATVTAGSQISGVLNPPAYVMATTVSGTQINLAWTDSSTGEAGYNVERKIENGSFSIIAYLAADVQSYADLGLQEGTTYIYRIQARGNGSNIADSTYSAEVSATTTGQSASKQTVLRFYIGRMYYYLNDEGQFMDAAPVIQSNRTLIPITYAALPLGIDVEWNESEQKVTLTKDNTIIELWIGKNQATVNGEKQYIDAKNPKVVPTTVSGRTMLPLTFIALTLNCQVDWDEATQEVKITYPKP